MQQLAVSDLAAILGATVICKHLSARSKWTRSFITLSRTASDVFSFASMSCLKNENSGQSNDAGSFRQRLFRSCPSVSVLESPRPTHAGTLTRSTLIKAGTLWGVLRRYMTMSGRQKCARRA